MPKQARVARICEQESEAQRSGATQRNLEPLGLPVELDERLAEGASRADALALLGSLADAVACTHGDVIELVLGRSLKKGKFAVVD